MEAIKKDKSKLRLVLDLLDIGLITPEEAELLLKVEEKIVEKTVYVPQSGGVTAPGTVNPYQKPWVTTTCSSNNTPIGTL